MTEEQRDDLLLEMHGQLAGVDTAVTRLQTHIESLNGRVVALGEQFAVVRARQDEHTSRISLLEDRERSGSSWRDRAGGVVTGVVLVFTALTALASLVITLWK